MINREEGLLEIYERIKLNRVEIGLTTFKRNPTEALGEDDFPYIIMDEGTDEVVEYSKRYRTGYPARRVCEVILEIGVNDDVDIRQIFFDVRKAVFTVRESDPVEYSPIIAENTFIQENRTEGPSGVDIPGILIMRLVLNLIYTDKGF